jgi:hypothetical protein
VGGNHLERHELHEDMVPSGPPSAADPILAIVAFGASVVILRLT